MADFNQTPDVIDALSQVEGEIADETRAYQENIQDDPQSEVMAINVRNAGNQKTIPMNVYPENTLGQVLDYAREKLRLGEAGSQVRFTNDAGDSEANPDTTIQDFHVKPNGTITIIPDGKVA